MQKQTASFLLIIFCVSFFSCEMVATLFHGEKPEEPPVTYTVAYDANGATGMPPSEQTVIEGTTITLPNIGGMASTGNTFVGWSESATIGVGTTYFVGDSITITRDMVFYAQWISSSTQRHTISFNANGSAGAPPASKTVYGGLNIIIPDHGSLVYAGKMFGGWNTEADGSGILLGANSLYTVSGSLILYAQWYESTNSFTVTFNLNGGSGAVPSAQTVSANAVITLPAGSGLSKDGFIFGGWNTDGAGTGSNYNGGSQYTVTGTITLFAKWNSFFTGMADISAYLASQQGGFAPEEPVYLPVQINLGTMTQTGSGWRQLLNAIALSSRYVDLDLSACTMAGTEFNPDVNVATGKDMIVSITLPNSITSILVGAFANTNLTSINIPNSVIAIGQYTFYNCTDLTSVTIGNSVTRVRTPLLPITL
ncbi:InlB B-repeat-containing protein [Treponema sp. R80B11-R83G3]